MVVLLAVLAFDQTPLPWKLGAAFAIQKQVDGNEGRAQLLPIGDCVLRLALALGSLQSSLINEGKDHALAKYATQYQSA